MLFQLLPQQHHLGIRCGTLALITGLTIGDLLLHHQVLLIALSKAFFQLLVAEFLALILLLELGGFITQGLHLMAVLTL